MKIRSLIIALSASVALTACGTVPAQTAPASDVANPADRADVASDGAMALLPVLDTNAGAEENVFFSPASIEQAFGILTLGSAGETRTQLQSVLPPPASARALENDSDGVEVRLANALWLSDQWRFQQGFVEAAAARYDATAERLDFSQQQAAADRINAWADEATEGLIPQVISADAVDPGGAAFISNALYFDGLWANAFDGSENAPFLFGDGKERDFRLMTDIFDLATARQGDWIAVRLPYRNPRYAMDVIMPRKRIVMQSAPDIETIATIGEKLAETDKQVVRMALPQMEIDYESGLIGPLRSLGLTLPFDPARADLSAMAQPGQSRLYVDKVTHLSKLQIFDIGTKAAAVTIMRIIPVSARRLPEDPYEFRVDRPFMVVIRDLELGAPLFVGRIANPQAFQPEFEEDF
ncbi:serpin family protein [Qipengyuania sp. DSG2-2]|uniref:serpin family protein n=1 Tax=Qipengyuania sp. DGS2-2 TaxID=3349631 RepID=UPI0036D29A2E